MTTVTFSMDDNRIRVFALDHAYGSQMVCNGISIMLYYLEAWLLNNPGSNRGHESEFKPGRAEILFIPNEARVFDILGFVIEGLEQVEYSYGSEFITVKVSEALKNLIR